MRERVGIEHPEAMNAGLPLPEDTPGGLNLEVMLWLRHLAVGWGMTEYGKMRFNLLGNGGHWFPGAPVESVEEVDTGALTSAVAESPYAGQIPGLIQQCVELLGGAKVKRLSES